MPPSRPPPTAARLALGFAVAPLVVPALHVALEVARTGEGAGGYVRYPLHDGVVAAVLWTAPLTYALALAVGIPVVLSLRALGRLAAGWVVGASTFAGAAVAGAIALLLVPADGLRALALRAGAAAAVAALLSAAVASGFCLVAGVGVRAPEAPGRGTSPRPTSS
jgi:hypothetical protein